MNKSPSEKENPTPEVFDEEPSSEQEGIETQEAGRDTDEAESSPNRRLSTKAYLLLGLLCLVLVASLILNAAFLLTQTSNTQQSYSPLILPLGVILAITTLASVVSLMIAQYYRIVYLKNGPALVPEKWGMLITKLARATHDLESSLIDTRRVVVDQSTETTSTSNKLLESFLTLQEMISSRDQEIERLKKGYDSVVFKKFLRRFIRMAHSLETLQANTENTVDEKNYGYLSRLLDDALEECGVESYTPESGTDYRNVGKEVADDPEEIETEAAENDFLIAECVETGYLLRGEASFEVVKQAKVKIYRYSSSK